MSQAKSLNPPYQVAADSQAFEILRLWAGTDGVLVTLNTAWKDPAAWGIALADIARHVANAYELEGAGQREQIASRVRQAFLAEWDEPTSDVEPTKCG